MFVSSKQIDPVLFCMLKTQQESHKRFGLFTSNAVQVKILGRDGGQVVSVLTF